MQSSLKNICIFFYVFIIINFFSTQWVTLNLKFSYCDFQSSTGITFLLVFLPCQAILYPQTEFRLAKVSDPEPAYQWGLHISVGIDKFFTKTLHYFFFFLSLEHDIRFCYRYNNLPVTVLVKKILPQKNYYIPDGWPTQWPGGGGPTGQGSTPCRMAISDSRSSCRP